MDPLFPALVGVGGTLLAALAGLMTSLLVAASANRTATRNLKISIEAEAEKRVGDRQAKLYVEILTYVIRRQVMRRQKNRPPEGRLENPEQEAFDWWAFRGKVEALASPPVLAAFLVAHERHMAVEDVPASRNRSSSDILLGAMKNADSADEVLIDLVRSALGVSRHDESAAADSDARDRP